MTSGLARTDVVFYLFYLAGVCFVFPCNYLVLHHWWWTRNGVILLCNLPETVQLWRKGRSPGVMTMRWPFCRRDVVGWSSTSRYFIECLRQNQHKCRACYCIFSTFRWGLLIADTVDIEALTSLATLLWSLPIHLLQALSGLCFFLLQGFCLGYLLPSPIRPHLKFRI